MAGTDLWSVVDAATDVPRSDAELASARRDLDVFGLPFELVWMPERGKRAGIPTSGRPAFAPNRGQTIRRNEILWRGDGVVATPNLFPFFWRQLILWPESGDPREADASFLRGCLTVSQRAGGTLLVNTIGASASIPLAHAHLVELAPKMLPHVPLVDVGTFGGAVLAATDPASAVPILVVRLQCEDPSTLAGATRQLLDVRSTAAVNLVAFESSVWVIARRHEVPKSGFPYAVGAGELWGRLIYTEREAFDSAKADGIGQALREATVAASPRELDALVALTR